MWYLLSLLLAPALGLRTLEPPAPSRVARNDPVELWLNVRLNHFMADNNDTFPMRYYYNELSPNASNVVIFVGGEWSISPYYASGGLAVEIAASLDASVFYTEHRYYGLTRPTESTSTPELRHLSVDQALGDLAQFIEHVKSESYQDGRYRDASVVLVGCSYAGTMATWMRLAYPHLVDAVVSDSGPLHAQEDFPEYLEVITEALRSQGSSQCVATIEEAVSEILTTLNTAVGVSQVSQLFNTCSTLAASSPIDMSTFFWFGITETFAYLVQAAAPGEIATACNSLVNGASGTSSMQRLAAWVNEQRRAPCLETRYSEIVAAYTNTSYDAIDVDMRLWTYQTCVEFGWYQTTTGDQQPFQSTVPLQYFHQMCRDFFPEIFSTALLRSGISRTNLFFAGLSFLPDYTVTVQGGHDPWSPMGPAEGHATEKAPVYLIPGASHCNAIGSMADSPTERIREVKTQVMNDITYFITGSRMSGASAVLSSVSLVIGAIIAIFTSV